MKSLLLLPLLFMFMHGCDNKPEEPSCPDVAPEVPTLTNDLDYEIFNAILVNYYTNLNYVHLIQKTEIVTADWIEYIKGDLSAVNADYDSVSLEDYSAKNKSFYFLSEDLLSINVRLMNSEELDCFISFEHSVWKKYYEKYPDSIGFFKFSRPGFNIHGDRAIVEYSWNSAFNVAMGYLVILEKSDGTWTIKDRIDIWAA